MAMTMKEAVYKLLDKVDGDLDLATAMVYEGPKKMALYVLWIGLNTIKAQRRSITRRDIKKAIKPELKPGKKIGTVIFTEKTKEKIFASTRDLFGDNGWKIGNISLGNYTKEDLLAQAVTEERSARGMMFNADFYRALAEPMETGQLVRDYWKPEDLSKIKDDIAKKEPATP